MAPGLGHCREWLRCDCGPVGQALPLFKRSRDLRLHGKLLNVGNWTFSKHPYGPQRVTCPGFASPSSQGPRFPRAQPWCGEHPTSASPGTEQMGSRGGRPSPELGHLDPSPREEPSFWGDQAGSQASWPRARRGPGWIVDLRAAPQGLSLAGQPGPAHLNWAPCQPLRSVPEASLAP